MFAVTEAWDYRPGQRAPSYWMAMKSPCNAAIGGHQVKDTQFGVADWDTASGNGGAQPSATGDHSAHTSHTRRPVPLAHWDVGGLDELNGGCGAMPVQFGKPCWRFSW